MSEKPSTTLPGTVEKIIKPLSTDDPEKAQITVEGADHLYREIRIENTLTDENGEKVRLKRGDDSYDSKERQERLSVAKAPPGSLEIPAETSFSCTSPGNFP